MKAAQDIPYPVQLPAQFFSLSFSPFYPLFFFVFFSHILVLLFSLAFRLRLWLWFWLLLQSPCVLGYFLGLLLPLVLQPCLPCMWLLLLACLLRLWLLLLSPPVGFLVGLGTVAAIVAAAPFLFLAAVGAVVLLLVALVANAPVRHHGHWHHLIAAIAAPMGFRPGRTSRCRTFKGPWRRAQHVANYNRTLGLALTVASTSRLGGGSCGESGCFSAVSACCHIITMVYLCFLRGGDLGAAGGRRQRELNGRKKTPWSCPVGSTSVQTWWPGGSTTIR